MSSHTHARWADIKRRREASVERTRGYREAQHTDAIRGSVYLRRKELGLTQTQLARCARTSQRTISRLELGILPARLDTLWRIAEALGCEVAVEIRPDDTQSESDDYGTA